MCFGNYMPIQAVGSVSHKSRQHTKTTICQQCIILILHHHDKDYIFLFNVLVIGEILIELTRREIVIYKITATKSTNTLQINTKSHKNGYNYTATQYHVALIEPVPSALSISSLLSHILTTYLVADKQYRLITYNNISCSNMEFSSTFYYLSLQQYSTSTTQLSRSTQLRMWLITT